MVDTALAMEESASVESVRGSGSGNSPGSHRATHRESWSQAPAYWGSLDNDCQMRSSILWLLRGLIVFALATPTHAQDTALTRMLIANRHPVRIVDGRLEERGGRLLVDAGKASRYFLVGEEHGVAQMPQIVQALLRELRPEGYDTFAIEVSPLQAARLDSVERLPNVRAAIDTLLASWYASIPFYSLAEERELLVSAMSPMGGSPAMRMWGLDYDVSGDRMFLRELERLAPPAQRAVVTRVREMADQGFTQLIQQGNPSQLFAFSTPDSVFRTLRGAFPTSMPARAKAIIDLLERTAAINRLFLSGRGYESNLMRSAFLRENFAHALADAEREGRRPRVLFKFGGSHMMRGVNYTHSLDIGTAAAVYAEAKGERAYHVLILGGKGSRSTRMNIQKAQYESTGTAELEASNLAWLMPAVADGEWSVFDLRAVKLEYLRRRTQGLTPVQDRFLHAYDAIVVIGGSTPGTPRRLEPRD